MDVTASTTVRPTETRASRAGSSATTALYGAGASHRSRLAASPTKATPRHRLTRRSTRFSRIIRIVDLLQPQKPLAVSSYEVLSRSAASRPVNADVMFPTVGMEHVVSAGPAGSAASYGIAAAVGTAARAGSAALVGSAGHIGAAAPHWVAAPAEYV